MDTGTQSPKHELLQKPYEFYPEHFLEPNKELRNIVDLYVYILNHVSRNMYMYIHPTGFT